MKMHSLSRILISSFLILMSLLMAIDCQLDPISSVSINSPPGAQALSPMGRYNDPRIVYYDLNTNSGIIRNLTSNAAISSFSNSNYNNVKSIQWLASRKIYIAGINWVSIIDDEKFTTFMEIVLPQQSSQYKICVSKGNTVMVAASLQQSKEITVYAENDKQLTIITNGTISAMAFDQTGNYLYYIEYNGQYNMVVYNLKQVYVFNTIKNIGGSGWNMIIASPKKGQQDITVSSSQYLSQLDVYDDYKRLSILKTPNKYKSIQFTNDGNYIYAASSYSLDIWYVSYSSFYWSYYSEYLTMNGNEQIQYFTVGSGYIIVYSSNRIMHVYEDISTLSLTIFIIVGVVIIFLIAVGFIIFICKKRRQRLENRLIGSQQQVYVDNTNPYGSIGQNSNQNPPAQPYFNPQERYSNQFKNPYENQQNNSPFPNQQNNAYTYQPNSQPQQGGYQPPRNW